MKKRILSIALALVFCMALLPAAAGRAYANPVPIYIGGVSFSPGESATCEGGVVTKSAVYSESDPIRCEKDKSNWSHIYLTDAVVTSGTQDDAVLAVYGDSAQWWTLHVSGDCTLASPGRYGMYCDIGQTRIAGDGTLHVSSGNVESGGSMAIRSIFTGGSARYGSVSLLEDVTVYATSGSSGQWSCGVRTEYSLGLTDNATLYATGGTAGTVSYGVYNESAVVNVSKNATLYAAGGVGATGSYGNSGVGMNVRNANVTVTGKTGAFKIGDGTGTPSLLTDGLKAYVSTSEDGSGLKYFYDSVLDGESNPYKYFTTVEHTVTHTVSFKAVDKYGGTAAPAGAHVQILNGEDVAAEFDATGGVDPVSGLLDGTTYTVHVSSAPAGFLAPADKTFTIDTYSYASYSGRKDGAVMLIECPKSWAVTLTAGAGMAKTTDSGALSQTVEYNHSIAEVVFDASDGYCFPTDYSVDSVNGVYVTRNSASRITVSGYPWADVDLTLPAATSIGKATTPAAVFTASGPDEGTLTNVTAGMTYSIDGGAPATISSTSVYLGGLAPCTISVVRPGDGVALTDSDPQTIAVTKAETPALTATQPSAVSGTGSIPTTTAHELRSDSTGWTPCGGESAGLAPGAYYVRVAASGTVLASDMQTITITAYTAPYIPPSYEPELVTEIDSGESVTDADIDGLIGAGETLTVTGEGGETAVLDAEALKGIDGAASGTVKIELTDVTAERPAAGSGEAVYDLTVSVGGKPVDDFGGELELTLPYEIGEKQNPKRVTVWKETEDGAREKLNADYDAEAGKAAFRDVGGSNTYVVGYEPFPFEDVTEEDYYYDAVDWADVEDITDGTGEATFSPARDASRADTVTFLWRAAGCPEPVSAVSAFRDVPANAYYYKAVLWAAENGVTDGVAEGLFDPNAPVRRGQAATFLYRFAEAAATGEMPFTDVPPGSFFEAAVRWAYNSGVTDGTGATTFSPEGLCQRGQLVAFLYRFFAA